MMFESQGEAAAYLIEEKADYELKSMKSQALDAVRKDEDQAWETDDEGGDEEEDVELTDPEKNIGRGLTKEVGWAD